MCATQGIIDYVNPDKTSFDDRTGFYISIPLKNGKFLKLRLSMYLEDMFLGERCIIGSIWFFGDTQVITA